MTSTDNPEVAPQPATNEQQAHQDTDAPPPSIDTPADNALESNVTLGSETEDPPQSLPQTSPPSLPDMQPSNDSDTTSASDVSVQDQTTPYQENLALTSLKAMFPDFDDAVLLSVLQSVGGDQERALDLILGMSDPDYVSQAVVEPTAPVPSQTDLDEQFARHLMLEEQLAHQAFMPGQPQPTPYDPVPYEARVHRGRAPQQQPSTGTEKDAITEFQEQFNKFAETGKKTIGSLFAKVKAKVSEFDQQRSGGQPLPRSSAGTSGAPVDHYTSPSYYDPNLPGQEARPIQGYDMNETAHGTDNTYPSSAMRSISDHTLTQQSTETNRVLPANTGTVLIAQTNVAAPAANIDPSKLGLLPKRPVSLLQPVSPPVRRDSDDDDLEYVENPFEEEGN